MSGQESSSSANDTNSLYNVVSSPSKVIKHCEKVLDINGISVCMTLVTMRRSFILVINNGSSGEMSALRQLDVIDTDDGLSKDDMIRGFTDSNSTLKGLSLAIGEHSTCIVNSDNSLASATLASRLSKKLNLNRPVYVANNFLLPYDKVNSSEFMAKLYLKIFQFVRVNYDGALDDESDITNKCDK